ncbi:hypothetical protein [Streptomyces thermodiastaticus]|jgi:hypothetical protein|uniref:hypothetical protein n=1 Tax=Streptomyces thermodiastaticus TaxID=44061 RepID=UPI00167BFD5B|nr:hypothetical protein [Streptomyces thermodiastaticus]MCE7548399.1 hypothetical protein [Streptomyces thermodiastaticus]GHF63117.1 hypothetical protein GCM10018787_09040 [Streptomyces thermodiastaticus]
MGIRMLNHRPAVSRAAVGAAPAAPASPVPAFAAGASTARIPVGPATAVRRAVTGLSRRLAPGEPCPWRVWADLARGYVALALEGLPLRPAPARTFTVFVAAVPQPAESPGGRSGRDPGPHRQDQPAPAGGPGRDDRRPHDDRPRSQRHGTRPDRRRDDRNPPGLRDR